MGDTKCPVSVGLAGPGVREEGKVQLRLAVMSPDLAPMDAFQIKTRKNEQFQLSSSVRTASKVSDISKLRERERERKRVERERNGDMERYPI